MTQNLAVDTHASMITDDGNLYSRNIFQFEEDNIGIDFMEGGRYLTKVNENQTIDLSSSLMAHYDVGSGEFTYRQVSAEVDYNINSCGPFDYCSANISAVGVGYSTDDDVIGAWNIKGQVSSQNRLSKGALLTLSAEVELSLNESGEVKETVVRAGSSIAVLGFDNSFLNNFEAYGEYKQYEADNYFDPSMGSSSEDEYFIGVGYSRPLRFGGLTKSLRELFNR